MSKIMVGLAFAFIAFFSCANATFAATDPRSQPNNKVCVGVLSPETDIADAALMVNSKSDWGYVVIIIKKSERDVDRWQGILNQLSKNHLIPIIRLATSPDSQGYWQKPTEEDATAWADFLSKLYFPTKNKYVQVYNEVNRAGEWGGTVDPKSYANELYKTIGTLKNKSEDFFVLNSPLDLALNTGPNSLDAAKYFQLMEQATPGIFAMLDGWASHSYPNPAFSASPLKSGRLGIDGYKWELSEIDSYLAGKNLPVFLTETGWRRSEVLDEDKISQYYSIAFSQVWNDNKIAAVCPFVFNYPDPQFSKFSFKANGEVLGKSYYNYYYKIQELSKFVGNPIRKNLLGDIKLNFPEFVIKNKPKTVYITVRNAGNFIWDAKNDLVVNIEADGVNIIEKRWDRDEVYPGQEASVEISMVTSKKGDIPILFTLSDREQILMEKDLSIKSETQLARLIRVVTDLI